MRVVSLDHVDRALDYLGCRADALALDPHTLADVLDAVLAVASATGRTAEGEEPVASLQARLSRVADAVAGERARAPWSSSGSIRPSVAATGSPTWWRPLAVRRSSRARTRSRCRSPGTTCGPSNRTSSSSPRAASAQPVRSKQARAVVDALPGVPVWALDGDTMVGRPGPRVVEGVEVMASVLHPEVMGPAPLGAAVRVA